MQPVNTIATPPEFAIHRVSLTAADGAISDQEGHGVNARGYRWAIVDVVLESGTLTDLDFQMTFWSEAASTFVASPDSQFAVSNLTASARIVVPVYGQRFWIYVTSMTGTSPVVSMYVAGFSEPTAH